MGSQLGVLSTKLTDESAIPIDICLELVKEVILRQAPQAAMIDRAF